VAISTDGGFVAAADDGLVRVAPDGAVSRLPGVLRRDFAKRGVNPGSVVILPDGNFAVADGRVWMVTAGPAQRLAAALRNLRLSAASVRAAISTTGPGVATLEASRAGRVLATISTAVGTGPSTIALAGRFRSRRGSIRLTLRSADGRIAGDELAVFLGSSLRVADARSLVKASLGSDTNSGEYVSRCRRFGRRRVDCDVHRWVNSDQWCQRVVAVTLPRTGLPATRHYRCRNPGEPPDNTPLPLPDPAR
jgi:hypothetical protein